MSSEHAYLTFQGGCPNHNFWSNEGKEKKWERINVLFCINRQELKPTHPITAWVWILFPSPCLTEHLQVLHTLAVSIREHFGVLLCSDRAHLRAEGFGFLSSQAEVSYVMSYFPMLLLSYVMNYCFEFWGKTKLLSLTSPVLWIHPFIFSAFLTWMKYFLSD